jgi:hypothetical protein
MTVLEQLAALTTYGIEEFQPFSAWDNPKIKDWKIRMRMLTVGDVVEITQLLANANPLEASYLNKIYTLAKTILTINDLPVVTDESLEEYNKLHSLSGINKLSLFSFKVFLIKQLSEPLLNRLSFTYDELQSKYVENLFGKTLSNTLAEAAADNISMEMPDATEQSSPSS